MPSKLVYTGPARKKRQVVGGRSPAPAGEDLVGSGSAGQVKQLVSSVSRGVSCESIELLREVFEGVSAGVVALDKQRRIRLTNAVLEAAVGLPREAALARRSSEVLQAIGGETDHRRCDEGDPCLACHVDDLALEALIRNQSQSRVAGIKVGAGSVPRVIELKTQAAPFKCGGDDLVLVLIEDLERLSAFRRWLDEGGMGRMIGRDPKMLDLYEAVRQVAKIDVSVLIEGESGVGKEMVASALHELSPRRRERMVPVNCGALSPGLLESELFGHVKGAFTGAFREKKGRFELAQRGTLFLDEIGELGEDMQVKLLRVLQDGTYERVGGEKTRNADVRLVCATNRNLEREVAAGRFRADLYYRLSVVLISVPPLRQRRDDIPLLTRHFLERAAEEFGIGIPEVPPDVAELLAGFSWPGNVRQLENCLRHALVKSGGGALRLKHIPGSIRGSKKQKASWSVTGQRRKLSLETVELALRETGGNKVQAAKSLGVSRATLYRFLARHQKSS